MAYCRRSAAAFSESSWLRLFVIELARPQDAKNRLERGIGEYGLTGPFSIRRTRLLSRPLREGSAHRREATQKPHNCGTLKYGSTEPLIGALPFWIWCVEVALDERTRAAEVAAALRDDLLAAIACGIQWRFEIDSSTARVSAPQPRSEGRLVGQLGRRQRMKFRSEQFCIVTRYAKGYERAGVPEYCGAD